MTVQELIDFLQRVEDKNKPVAFYSLYSEGTKSIVDVTEYNDEVLLYDY